MKRDLEIPGNAAVQRKPLCISSPSEVDNVCGQQELPRCLDPLLFSVERRSLILFPVLVHLIPCICGTMYIDRTTTGMSEYIRKHHSAWLKFRMAKLTISKCGYL